MKKAGLIFLLGIIITTGVLRLHYLTQPVNIYNNSPVEIVVEAGSAASTIAEKLYQNGLIRSKRLFNFFVVINGLDDKLKAGLYDLRPSYNLTQIFNILIEGQVATFKITLPEGFTFREIVERLAGITPYDEKEIYQVAEKLNRPYFPDSPGNYKYNVEGFLYPDTYIIPREYTPEQILEVFLTEFERRWYKKLQRAGGRGDLTPQQIMTIASLIEEEAKLEHEKTVIAAVIYNRLKKNMLLQIDASVQYSLPARTDRVLYRDLEVDSPYNTYQYEGLPPGPVCSPGESSIRAALNPAEIDYLFYFARKDGSHQFTKTYKDHLRLQQKLGVSHE